MVQQLIDFILHIDRHLVELVQHYDVWIYLILFLIIFAETGFVVTPFLPGDSLLFAAGTIAAVGEMNILYLFVFLLIAAIAGNLVNYQVGFRVGDMILQRHWIKEEYLQRTHAYFEKYGVLTIVISRFIPIIRTIAPFVAGLGKMGFSQFSKYNLLGGLLWISLFLFLGYFVGNIPVIRQNFSLVTIGIIILSLIPVFIPVIRRFLPQKV